MNDKRKLIDLLENGCSGCDFDEAEGGLMNHCSDCCRKITTLAYYLLVVQMICSEFYDIEIEPLCHADGTLEQFMPKVDGKPFRCECGCNVFHKPDKTDLELFKCNSCGLQYRGNNDG